MSGDEVRQAVAEELSRFFQHMRDTVVSGVTLDDWVRSGLDWYIETSAPQARSGVAERNTPPPQEMDTEK